MGADNVDVFKHIVFGLPPLRVQVAGMVALSPVYATFVFLAFRAFAPLEFHPTIIPWGALLIFALPFLVAGELFHRVLSDYPRTWSYFLSATNQLFVFIYALILSGADNTVNAWRIVWLALITVSLTNVLVLTVSVGPRQVKRIVPLSLVQPLLLIGTFQLFIGRSVGISNATIAINLGVLLIVVGFLVAILKVFDYLIGSNADVSAFRLTSGILKGERAALDLGYVARPAVQTLRVDNGEALTLAAPWIHPGPLGGFGGGELSGEVIDALNEDSNGFFLHVPCTHEEDLANPDDIPTVLDAVSDPETVSRASPLYAETYDDVEFYGRRIDGKKIVFFEAAGIDDYHPGVFMRDVPKDEVLLVDMHNHHIHAELDREVQYGTEEADRLKRCFDDFLETLDDVETYEYSAGFDVHCGEYPVAALVEAVDGQETLLYGVDTNGVTDDLRALRDRYEDEFDEVILFSTDTHASVHDLANADSVDIDAVERTVETARDSLAPAQIGLDSAETEPLRLLKLDYSGLVFSVNILIRLVLISLAVYYIFLVLWIF